MRVLATRLPACGQLCKDSLRFCELADLMHFGRVGAMALWLFGGQGRRSDAAWQLLAIRGYEVPPQDLPVLLNRFPAIPSSTFVAARPTGLAADTHGA